MPPQTSGALPLAAHLLANHSLLPNQLCIVVAVSTCYERTQNPFCTENCTFHSDNSGGGQRAADVTETVLVMLVMCVVFAAAMLGNSLVLVVVVKSRSLHKTTNFFLINLVVSDLMIALFNIWPFVVEHCRLEMWKLVEQSSSLNSQNSMTSSPSASASTSVSSSSPKQLSNLSVFIGILECKISRFIQILAITSGALTLTLIACDRFFGIMCTLKAHMTDRKASVFLASIWIVSIVLASPLLMFGQRKSRVWRGPVYEHWCVEEFPGKNNVDSRNYRMYFYLALIMIFYVIPAIIMTCAYACIVWRIWRQRMPFEPSSIAERNLRVRQKKKVTIVLIMILILFYISWTPMQIISLYEIFYDKKKISGYRNIRLFSHLLSYLNGCLYPILFAGYNENFQKAFLKIFPCFTNLFNTKCCQIICLSTLFQSRQSCNYLGNKTNRKSSFYEKSQILLNQRISACALTRLPVSQMTVGGEEIEIDV